MTAEASTKPAFWMGAVPPHWEVKALKFCADLVTERLDGSGLSARYIGLEHIEGKTGRLVRLDGSQDAAESTVNCFCRDDVLFGKLRPYLAKAAVADSDGVCSSEILVYRPHGLTPEYLKHVMLLDGFIEEVNSSTYGSKMPRADASFVSRLPVPQPPVEEQAAIASYLDAETDQIDALIEEKQRLIELLRELRGGVIRERTAGLDRIGARHETGNQFMPTLPEGWMLVGLGRYTSITNGSTPLKDNAAFWEGGTYPWLNSAVVNGDEVTEGSELVTPEALRLCHLPIVPAGSVLVALTGQGKTRGQATVLRIEATINQHLAAIVCDGDHLDGEFLFWVLTGQYAALRMVSDGQGGTKGALTCDELGRFPIPKPPVTDQRNIAKVLHEETRRIDELLEHVRREIATLQELRSSTITDAVLGRLRVPTATKRADE